MIKYLIKIMKKEMSKSNVKVVVTSGMASLICEDKGMAYTKNNYLTLDGLRIIYDKFNKKWS